MYATSRAAKCAQLQNEAVVRSDSGRVNVDIDGGPFQGGIATKCTVWQTSASRRTCAMRFGALRGREPWRLTKREAGPASGVDLRLAALSRTDARYERASGWVVSREHLISGAR